MITLVCLRCRLALRLSGDHDEMDYLIGMKSDWYPDRYPCPRSSCHGTMTLTDTIASVDLEQLEIYDLNPQEAFQAMHGMGLPVERSCDIDTVRSVLSGHSITSMDLQGLPGTNRTVIHSLTLADGTRVYLASSPLGAVVYRIAPPHSHVKDLENGS